MEISSPRGMVVASLPPAHHHSRTCQTNPNSETRRIRFAVNSRRRRVHPGPRWWLSGHLCGNKIS